MCAIIAIRSTLVFLLFLDVFALSDHDSCLGAGKQCFSYLFNTLPPPPIIKGTKISVSLKAKMELTNCFKNIVKKCGGLGFLEMYDLGRSILTCDKDGCPDDTAYEARKCLDDHRDIEIACMAQGVIKAFEIFLEKQDMEENDLSCSIFKLAFHCLEEIAGEKCGEEAKAIMSKELKVVYKQHNICKKQY